MRIVSWSEKKARWWSLARRALLDLAESDAITEHAVLADRVAKLEQEMSELRRTLIAHPASMSCDP